MQASFFNQFIFIILYCLKFRWLNILKLLIKLLTKYRKPRITWNYFEMFSLADLFYPSDVHQVLGPRKERALAPAGTFTKAFVIWILWYTVNNLRQRTFMACPPLSHLPP